LGQGSGTSLPQRVIQASIRRVNSREVGKPSTSVLILQWKVSPLIRRCRQLLFVDLAIARTLTSPRRALPRGKQMPNGGGDNCWACGFNRANSGQWHGYHDLAELAYCTIRDVNISNPLWTYCANMHTRQAVPEGPILASGIYENGYVRIPWHGDHEPLKGNVQGECAICGRVITKGIQIDMDTEGTRSFCCNSHYLSWWKAHRRT